ncbi:DUF192 domain-containing protein [Halobacteriales archaeon Cl-PHB]
MDARKGAVLVVALVGCAAVALVLAFPPAAFIDPGEYDRTTVSLVDDNGTGLATVDVRIADTRDKRRIGLSETDSLDTGEGMLFVHPRQGPQAYHMKDMDFPLDIVFVANNGTITTIHHAPVPEKIPGGDGRFSGVGRFVLEVPRGYTNVTGVDVGDRVEIPELVTE